jgi:serine/threonine protein kinase
VTAKLRAGFEREARIISQLQHPNICVLHDVGNDVATNFLGMEFLEGESLAERLKKGPFSAEELLASSAEFLGADSGQAVWFIGRESEAVRPDSV